MPVEKRRVIVSGGTGFIGKSLCELLFEAGYSPVVLSRDPGKVERLFEGRVSGVKWDGKSADGWLEHAEGAYGIVNLAGASIGSGRWTPAVKKDILESRVDAGRAVADAVERAVVKPMVIVQGSAVGYYADLGDEPVGEDGLGGRGFLSGVVREWESTTLNMRSMGVRVAAIRTGLVLGRGGPLIDRLAIPMRIFMGGPMGNGRQWISWIHLKDEVGAIRFLLEHDDLEGIFNLVSPNPVRNSVFMKKMGTILRRPSWLRIPGFVLRAALGEMAEETVLSGTRAKPARLLDAGFEFSYPDIDSAFREIFA